MDINNCMESLQKETKMKIHNVRIRGRQWELKLDGVLMFVLIEFVCATS